MIRVTKEFRFEMAHALQGYDGPCRNIHGHSYRLLVTLKGIPLNDPGDPRTGMVMDFSELKQVVVREIITNFDHALVLRRDTASSLVGALEHHKLVLTDFQPTCENLALYFVEKLRPLFPPEKRLDRLILYETETSSAEWQAEDH
ncbi:MAG TPA: 6-carboxytetrahydropterin synthase [Fluviicola sp.]|nr:6-carboxytetrahydropterin synthase [Fluviicola sp.]